MQGRTMEDYIHKRVEPSLTEGDVVDIIRCSDPG